MGKCTSRAGIFLSTEADFYRKRLATIADKNCRDKDISKLLFSNCNAKTTPPAQKCLPSPCCRLFFGKYILGRTIHTQSNIERVKGRGKIGNKSGNVSQQVIGSCLQVYISLSCLNDFVRFVRVSFPSQIKQR